METIRINGNTHTGRRRTANQDAWIVKQLWSADKALAVVIDGVGGYAGGERAAAIAKDCIEQYMQSPSGDTLTMLREALIFANNKIAEERKKDQRFSEMCCVLTALVADTTAQSFYYVHVGDTRLYRLRAGKLVKLTRDHSFVGIREDAGEITEDEAMAHPHRNQILREVGSAPHRLDDEDFMDYGRDDFLPGDTLLLCSDGLTDMITSKQVAGILLNKQPLPVKTSKLIELANEAGGNDNITVALLQYPAGKQLPKKETVAAPVSANIETATAPNKKIKQRGKTGLLSALLVLTAIVVAGWYFIAPKKALLPATGHFVVAEPTDTAQTDSSHMQPGGRANHAAVQGPETPEEFDTLRIASTQNFIDLKKYTDSTRKTLVLLPKNYTNKHFAAVSIASASAHAGDTLEISNLRMIGFENGIDIHVPIVLKAANIVFENTTTPFRYLFKPGDKQAAILIINTAKQ